MLRSKIYGALGLLAMACAASAGAGAQNSPGFTIKRPPDGATVREKVRVEVPLASIPESGYVAYSVDGQFLVALAPTQEDRTKEEAAARRGGRVPVFVWTWDTKAPIKVAGTTKNETPKDGEHTVAATLYAPKGDKTGGSVLKETSSVKVTVANKANADPGAILLRYRYPDGATRVYNRNGQTAVVGGLTEGLGGTSDQELVSQKSKLLTEVQDVYRDGRAIVRNKLTNLEVRQGGQDMIYPTEQLPESLYQEVNPTGHVLYQNESPSWDQFAQLGVPVETTLELPKLPSTPVRIGDKWSTPAEKLDIPGTPPDKQPKVTLTSTLEGIEWEGGYPTAHIHQSFDSSHGGIKDKTVTFGTILVESPTIKYDRDIYLAYRSGTLVRVDRKLEVSGKSTQYAGQGAAPGGPGMGARGGMGMPMGAMGGSPYGAMGGSPYGAIGGPGAGGKGAAMGGMGAPMGPMGPRGGMSSGPYGGQGGMMRGGRGRRSGGYQGSYGAGPSGVSGSGAGPYGQGAGSPYGGYPGASGIRGGSPYGGGMGSPYGGGGYGGAPTGQQSTSITLKSTSSTELERARATASSR